ncbi:MAG: ParB/RepB/Spo0J family partition protein [Clostridium butyricum]|nr:chromosome partitioning protein ParB [Clostridium butyricum]
MSSYLKGIANRVNNINNTNDEFLQELDIDLLVPSENNFYGIREIEELADSIKEFGLMHNLVVRKKDNETYEIISGERRYRALKSLEYKKIPCQVREITDLDAEIMLIQANVEQRELLPSEKMEGIKRLKAIYKQKKANGEELPKGKIRDLIGQDMKLSGTQVGRYQKIDKDLIKPLKEKLDKEELTITQAHTLSSLSIEEQNIIHDEIKDLDHKESKEEIETLINGIKQPVTNKNDKKLLKEMYPENKETDKNETIRSEDKLLDDIKKALDKFALNPKFIISNEYIKGTFYTSEVKIIDSKLSIKLSGICRVGFMNIIPKIFEQVDEIEIEDGKKITPKHGYKITDDVYISFNNKI